MIYYTSTFNKLQKPGVMGMQGGGLVGKGDSHIVPKGSVVKPFHFEQAQDPASQEAAPAPATAL